MPAVNAEKRSINEIAEANFVNHVEVIVEAYEPMNITPRKTPKVSAAAMMGLSVSEEIHIPIEIITQPRSNIPIKA